MKKCFVVLAKKIRSQTVINQDGSARKCIDISNTNIKYNGGHHWYEIAQTKELINNNAIEISGFTLIRTIIGSEEHKKLLKHPDYYSSTSEKIPFSFLPPYCQGAITSGGINNEFGVLENLTEEINDGEIDLRK